MTTTIKRVLLAEAQPRRPHSAFGWVYRFVYWDVELVEKLDGNCFGLKSWWVAAIHGVGLLETPSL